jgi:hypothetical protein
MQRWDHRILHELAQTYPNEVTLYRKERGNIWDGKLEMVNVPVVTEEQFRIQG